MKCPKCGFLNDAGSPQCKKCGQENVSSGPSEGEPFFSTTASTFSTHSQPNDSPVTSGPAALADETSMADSSTAESPNRRQTTFKLQPETAAEKIFLRPWREELSERVENFRRRRARLLEGVDPDADFDIDYETGASKPDPDVSASVVALSAKQETKQADLDPPSSDDPEDPLLDSLPLEKPGDGLRILSEAAVQAGEAPIDDQDLEPGPVEIVLESPERLVPAASGYATSRALPTAPLGRRVLAGVVDGTVLWLAAGLFATIFWLAGGRISLRPVNIAVLAFIALFSLLLYFGLFTAFAAATPGLLAMGLDLRNMEGTFPTTGESIRRAFGYLVSIAALMLGFVWALVDSEGMTWHDRMSGTFVADRDSGAESRG